MDNDFDFEPDDVQPWEDDAYETSYPEDDDYDPEDDDYEGDYEHSDDAVLAQTSKARSEPVKEVTAELSSYEVRVREARPNDPGQWEVDIINTDTGAEGGYKYVSAPTIYEALAKAVELVPSVTW